MSTLKVNSIQSFTGAAPVVLNDEVGISGSLQVSGNFMPNAGGTHALGTMAEQLVERGMLAAAGEDDHRSDDGAGQQPHPLDAGSE